VTASIAFIIVYIGMRSKREAVPQQRRCANVCEESML